MAESRLSETLRLCLPLCAGRVLNFDSFFGLHILVRESVGGAVGEIHQLSGDLVGEAQQVGRARARYLYPASRLRCQYRGHIIRVRSENTQLLVNAGIIIKTLGQAANGLVLRQPR